MSTPAAVRALEYYLVAYRRTWRGTAITSFVTPVLFLVAMGFGLGSLVEQSPTADLAGVSYVAFLAPGLLAAAAMQTATGESTWPVLGALKWVRTYHAQIATPLEPADIAGGHFLFVTLRVILAATAFLVVMLAFGTVGSWLALLAVPAAILTGLAFSGPITAYAVSRQNEQGFTAIFRFVLTPMFLFSGTFFPVTQLPAAIRWIAYVTPLWHGVALCRGLTLGTATLAGTAVHVAFLTTVAAAGIVVSRRLYELRLHP